MLPVALFVSVGVVIIAAGVVAAVLLTGGSDNGTEGKLADGKTSKTVAGENVSNGNQESQFSNLTNTVFPNSAKQPTPTSTVNDLSNVEPTNKIEVGHQFTTPAVPTMRVPPELKSQLVQEFAMGDYGIRVPSGFKLVQSPSADAIAGKNRNRDKYKNKNRDLEWRWATSAGPLNRMTMQFEIKGEREHRGNAADIEKHLRMIKRKRDDPNPNRESRIVEISGRVVVGGIEFVRLIIEVRGRGRVFTALSLVGVDRGREMNVGGGTFNSRSSREFKLIEAALYSLRCQAKTPVIPTTRVPPKLVSKLGKEYALGDYRIRMLSGYKMLRDGSKTPAKNRKFGLKWRWAPAAQIPGITVEFKRASKQRGSNAALEKAIREKSARNNGDENLHIIEVGRVSVGGVEFVKVISETCGRRVFTHLSLTRVDQGSELSMMGGTYNSRSSSEFKLIKAALYSFHLQSK